MPTKIKLCGLTNREDLNLVAAEGADYGGVLVGIESVRGRTFEQAVELCANPPLPIITVTLDRDVAYNLRVVETIAPAALQLHGHESPEVVSLIQEAIVHKGISCEVWKVVHLPAAESDEALNLDQVKATIESYIQAGANRILLDATVIKQGERHLGGTGMTVDWQAARHLRESISVSLIVAGGLNPDNVAEAVREVQPYAVDLSSGVEASKGKKDPLKVRDLITRVRQVD